MRSRLGKVSRKEGSMITIYGLNAFMPQLKGIIRDIRPVWTLEELGLPYQRNVMSAQNGEHKTPAYLAIHPFGKVPAMTDGDFALFESAAICTYLGDKQNKLIPAAGTLDRAVYDQWVLFAASTLDPVAARVLGIDFFIEKKDATLIQYRNDALESLTGMIAALDKELGKRPYILGEAFSIADILLSSSLRIVNHTEVTAKFPNVQAYLNKNFARPAFVKALENNG